MRPMDYCRRRLESKEADRTKIVISVLPPLMDEQTYREKKNLLLNFWSYYYQIKQETAEKIERELGESDPVYEKSGNTDIEAIFDRYRQESRVDLSVIVEAARRLDPKIFQMLEVTGRARDPKLLRELETHYGEVPALHLAFRLLDHTLSLWDAHDKIVAEEEDSLNIDELRRLRKNALEMAKYILPATHVTREESVEPIDRHGLIENSDWRGKYDYDYEGNGVYLGIFGAYRDWNGGEKIYEFPMALENAFPILVKRGEYLAMANTLCEYVRCGDTEKGQPMGAEQWWQAPSQATHDWEGRVFPWQEDLLYQLYGKQVTIYSDKEGRDVVVVDTTDPPIVLATVGKYLNLYRCMSRSAWNRLPESDLVDEATDEDYPEAEKFDKAG